MSDKQDSVRHLRIILISFQRHSGVRTCSTVSSGVAFKWTLQYVYVTL